MIWPLLIAAAAGAAVASLRWLRVAQREHYLAPAVTRFAWRWWNSTAANQVLGLLAAVGVVGSFFLDAGLAWLGLGAVIGPLGLPWRGRTSPLVWTPRLRRLAGGTGFIVLLLVLWSLLIRHPGPAMAAVVVLPRLVDAANALLAPLERRLAEKWIDRARSRLRSSGARVVAITGSYGKTTTKGYLAHLLSGRRATVATPASFNNRLGIARAINEQLVPGTEVFVVEMGTYGPGEIRALCDLAPPDIAVITAIGPVHLERFGSEERIVAAKSEILEQARVAVLNVDYPGLQGLADNFRGRVVRTSSVDRAADVAVVDRSVLVEGESIARLTADVFDPNVASAVGAALALDLRIEEIAPRLDDLPTIPHRRQVTTSQSGVVVIDNTYNSNPAGARAALHKLMGIEGGGRRVVVTPGMVELGSRQHELNSDFAAEVASLATDLVVVGRTNRRSLLEGAGQRRAMVTVVDTREEAVAWVRAHLEPGDAVLYENDLPDHYP